MRDEKQSLADKVFEILENSILNGQYHTGDILTENKLSSELGVSRTPIREALHRLESEGLVQSMHNRGVQVLGVSFEDAAEAYEIRMRIEGLAARRAAEHMDDEQLAKLMETIELQEFYVSRPDNSDKLRALDSQLHDLIYDGCASTYLKSILTDLHHRIQRYRMLSISCTSRAEAAVAEHRSICEAISSRNGDLAEARMISHIQAAYENVKQHICKNQ